MLELSRDACPPPPGPLVCPPGAISDNEPACADEYVDNTNGGCNSDPNVFTNLPCGTDVAVCGTYGNYLFQGGQYRDTDWYQITVTQNETLTWCVEGEAPTLAAILDGTGGCAGLSALDVQVGNTRQQFCCTANVGPGTYWLFVSTQGFTGVPCGSKYVAHLTGHNCPNQCHALAIQCPEDHPAIGYAGYNLPFALCNVGTCADSFRVSIADLYGWGGPLHTTVFLNPGQCDTFYVNFVVPVPCDPGTLNIVKFIASAVGDPSVIDSCQTRLICTGTTPVQFSDLSAEPGRGTVDVSWQAAIEGGTVFRVFRSGLRFGDYQPVSEEIQKTTGRTYHFVDQGLKPSTEYFYKIGYLESSKWRYSEMFRVITPAAVFAINRIAPNPTSGFTRIDYEIPRGGQVNLDLFNLQGEKVRRLLDVRKEAGSGSATWDGRNDRGESLPAGAYFMRLVADGRMLTRRIVIIH